MYCILLLSYFTISLSLQQICPDSAPYDVPNIDKGSDSDYILIQTSGCPPYANPKWTNPNNAEDQGLTLKIPKNPKYAKSAIPVGEELEDYMGVTYLKNNPAPILGSIGVLENGVLLYGMGSPCGVGKDSAPCPSDDSNAPSNYIDAFESEGHTFDQCGGHPSNMNGQYHIHSGNTFTNNTGRSTCNLPTDTVDEHSVRLGWMFDGFPIYGQYSQGGLIPTQLDPCHGHTHEIDGEMTYHYHMPSGFPYVIGCYKGCPESSNNQIELSKFNGPTYDCPNGLSDDPNPVFEVYNTSASTITPSTTMSTTKTVTATSDSSSGTGGSTPSMTVHVSPTPSNMDSGASTVTYSTSCIIVTLLTGIAWCAAGL